MEDSATKQRPKRKRLSEIELLAKSVDHADLRRERRKMKRAGRIPEAALQEGTLAETVPRQYEERDTTTITEDASYNSNDSAEYDNMSVETNNSDLDSTKSSVCTEDLLASGDTGGDLPEGEIPNESSNGNRLIHFGGMKEMIENNCICSSCQGRVTLSKITVGIATTAVLVCDTCETEEKRCEPLPSACDGDYAREAVGMPN